MKIPLKKIIVFVLIGCFSYSGMLFAQGEIQIGAVAGESYLDGYDLSTLVGINEQTDMVFFDDEVWSYLDGIERELVSFEEHYFSQGAVEGFYHNFDECIQTAVKQHLPLQIAQDKISLAKRRLIKIVRDLLPTFNIYYEHNVGFKIYKDNPNPSAETHQQFRSEKTRISVAQPLFRGGAIWNQVKVERAKLRVAKSEYKKVYQDITVEVARAYFSLMKATKMVTLREKLDQISRRAIAISQEKIDANLISEIEHLNVQSQQSQIQHDLESAREEVELNLMEFKKVLHLDIDAFVDVAPFDDTYVEHIKAKVDNDDSGGTSRSEIEQEQKLDVLTKLAYQNRPEFTIQKDKVEAAVWQEKVATSGWFPQINLLAEVGRKAESYKTINNNPPWDDEHHVGIEFKWNFGGNTSQYTYDKDRQGTGVEATDVNIAMDGYYDRKNTVGLSVLDGLGQFVTTKEAEVARKEALLELELSEKDVMSEVKESYYNYNRALIQLRSIFKRLRYREKLVDLAYHRSEINEIQTSEYMQAETDLVNEKATLYQALVDYSLSIISFNKAVGIKDYIALDEL
ncbi:MAG: TolC family protein [Candidatus Omnitrophica bacterium]|nr:TolC family protein [Candidatus Omnitrophota bacterium]